MHEYPVPALDFALESPVYGQFVGHGMVIVSGRTGSAETVLRVEGERVDVAEDGTFRVEVPVDHPYRNIEVTADLYEQHAEARVPVFDGTDPALSFPGAMTMRLTDRGLDGIAAALAGTFEALVAEEALLALVPTFDVVGWTFGPVAARHDPVSVGLVPDADGLEASFALTNLEIDVMLSGEILFFPVEVPATLRLPEVSLSLLMTPGVGAAGEPQLTMGAPAIGFANPELEILDLDLAWLSELLLGALDIGALLTDASAGLLGGLAPIPLGTGAPTDLDLLGFAMSLRTSELMTDPGGLGLGFAVGLGQPAPGGPPTIPYPPADFSEPVDLTIAVHEGMLQPLLQSELLAMLSQDIMLPGFLGFFIENIVRGIPGGELAPEAYGWCVGLEMGEARVARFQPGTTPLVGIYLPDARVSLGYYAEGQPACTDWLVSSLALEVGLDVTDGTMIAIDLSAPEGQVLFYGAPDQDEVAVIGQLSSSLTGLLGLLGGLVQIDLADIVDTDALLGDLETSSGVDLPDLALAVRGAQPVTDDAGLAIDGLWAVGVQLFGEAP